MSTDTSNDFLKRFNSLTHLLNDFECAAFNRGEWIINDKDIYLPTGFVDSNHGKCIDTRNSITGFIFYIGICVINWQPKQQTLVALSSMEAEYMEACVASQEAIWLGRLRVRMLILKANFTSRWQSSMYMSLETLHNQSILIQDTILWENKWK